MELTGKEKLYVSEGQGLGGISLDEISDFVGSTGPGGSVDWADITSKPTTFPPAIGATASTAMAGNTALLSVGSTAGAPLAASAAAGTATTAARSDHVHALPASSALQIAAITTAGGTVIAAGTLQAVLQAIADLADPDGA
jgi:hypothetical protein